MRKSVLRSVRLDDDVWETIKAMDRSLNAYLREAFFDAGAIRYRHRSPIIIPPPTQTILDDTEIIRASVDAEIKQHNRRAFKPPLLKPSEKKKC